MHRNTTTTTVGRSSRSRGPWMAIVLSLLAFAAVLAAAIYLPGWLARGPQAQPAQSAAIDPKQAQLEQARSQAALVAAEDTRLITQLRSIPWNSQAYLDRAHGAPTLILTARPTPYTLDSLLVRGAAQRIDATTVALINSVVVGPGARLTLHAPGTTLRMTSTTTGFTSLVGWKGSIALTGAPGQPLTLTSWDPATSSPDQQVADGRSYVRVAGSDLQTHFAALSHLGFWSGRTGGLAITGSESDAGTGSVTGTTMHASHYGLFSSDTNGLTITDSTFDAAATDGILLYRGSVGSTIGTSTARGNAGSGIVADRGASAVTVRDVTAERNVGDGIRFDGRPLADRPSAAGSSLDGQQGFRVQDSTARFNLGNGVLVWDADDTVVTSMQVINNADGIVVRGPANRVQISANTVTSSAEAGIAVRDGATEVTVDHNTVAGANTGIQVRGARADVHDNAITAARSHGLSFLGAAQGSSARGNTLAGSGPSGLDLARLDKGVAVSVFNNSEDQWQVTRSMSDRLLRLLKDHPLLAVWTPLLVLPIVASLLGRRHRRRRWPARPSPGDPASPYIAAPVSETDETPPTATRSVKIPHRPSPTATPLGIEPGTLGWRRANSGQMKQLTGAGLLILVLLGGAVSVPLLISRNGAIPSTDVVTPAPVTLAPVTLAPVTPAPVTPIPATNARDSEKILHSRGVRPTPTTAPTHRTGTASKTKVVPTAAPSRPPPSDPGSGDPDPNDPGPNDPDPNDPGPNDPDPNDPDPNDPGPNDPGPNDPDPNDPDPNDPGSGESNP